MRKESRPAAAGDSPPGASPSAAPAAGSEKDRFFESPSSAARDFMFGHDVANVFDDMVSRSVPQYAEIQRMTCEMAADFARPGTAVYDYGCGTATTLNRLEPLLAEGVKLVGVDQSESMLERAREKLSHLAGRREFELCRSDLHDEFPADNASVSLMVLTLQFLRPLHRERIIKRIYQGLVDQGCFILVEKVIGQHGLLNRQFIKYYYEMKRRNGYSDEEIVRKREALENVLVPYRADENIALLRDAGFSQVEEFFRWYNFCGVVAVK
jgi:tRNA (cmo5U34)-methyltransferase